MSTFNNDINISSSTNIVDDVSNDIEKLSTADDVDAPTRSEMTSPKKKCTSCEQKLVHTKTSSNNNNVGQDIVQVQESNLEASNRRKSNMDTSDESCNDGSKSNNDLSDAIGYLRLLNMKDNNAKVGNVCANCGKEGANNTCNKCKMVKYCNAACKKKHKTKHRKACDRRMAELHDIELFKEPPSLREDCPICFQRLSLIDTGKRYYSCCGKTICCGCIHAMGADMRKLCPFCRTPASVSDEESNRRMQKRVDIGDAEAMSNFGFYYSQGIDGLPQDYTKALELWGRAGELGHAEAFFNIGCMYVNGRGVARDRKKAVHYFELGAMGGDADSRHNLGTFEYTAGNTERAMKHFMIAVEGGSNSSLKRIQELYSGGQATRDEYTNALRAYQEYLVEVKSSQRDEAAAYEDYKYIE